MLEAGAQMKITASPNWWRITAIILVTSPVWLKALAFAMSSITYGGASWPLWALLAAGAAALGWFAWSGLALTWLAISSGLSSRRPQQTPHRAMGRRRSLESAREA
jgi:hypothetical protein